MRQYADRDRRSGRPHADKALLPVRAPPVAYYEWCVVDFRISCKPLEPAIVTANCSIVAVASMIIGSVGAVR